MTPLSTTQADQPVSAGRALWTGLAPLAWVALVVLVAVAATTAAHVFLASLGFLTWRWVTLGVWAIGLVLAVVVYILSTRRALRQALAWRAAGLNASATLVYWGLALVALVVVLPLVLGLLLPQHPAP